MKKKKLRKNNRKLLKLSKNNGNKANYTKPVYRSFEIGASYNYHKEEVTTMKMYVSQEFLDNLKEWNDLISKKELEKDKRKDKLRTVKCKIIDIDEDN